MELVFLFFRRADQQQNQNTHYNGSQSAEGNDNDAFGVGFFVGGNGFVQHKLIAYVLVHVHLCLGGTGLKVGQFVAFLADELGYTELVLRGAAQAVLEVAYFLFHLIANPLHDIGGIAGTGVVDAVAYGIVVGSNEIGHVGCPLGVDIKHGHLHTKEFGAPHIHVAAVLFV